MKKTILSIIAAAAVFSSCSTSQGALGDLRQLSTQINIEGSTYGVREWKHTATRYYKIDRKIAKYAADGAYTNQELEEIGALQTECVGGFARGVGQNIGNKIENAASVMRGIARGLGF